MSQNLIVIKNAVQSKLGAPAPAKMPVGDLIAQQKTAQDQECSDIQANIGIWESSPGKFKRHIAQREFSHIIKGRCTFTPEGGEPIELCEGDAVLFPADCQGVWDIQEDFRKTYCIF